MLLFQLFSLGLVLSVHSQVSLIVRWNGRLINESPTNRDDRLLIYHDEIDVRTDPSGGVPDGPGVLVCRHSDTPGDVSWSRPANDTPIQSNNRSDFTIFEETYGYTRVQLARTRSVPQDVASNEGLWTCNGGGLPLLHVAIYARGNGAIVTNVVTLQSSSFESIVPTFTLIGNTTGGPPTTAVWLRNGRRLFFFASTSIVANPNNDEEGRVNAHYRSTLVITGMLPGVYEYQVNNKATSGSRSDRITIEGGNPSNLRVALVDNSTVRVSWTPPEGPPSGGYRIVDAGNGLDRPAPSSPQELVLPPGDYNIQVSYTSQHLPGGSIGPQAVTVLGALQPIFASVLQLTPTTVSLSWRQPQLSFIPDYFQLALNGSSQNYCSDFTDSRSEIVIGGSSTFNNLQEFSVYRIRVTANFQVGSNSLSTFAETEIITESKAPTGTPRSVIYSSTSTSITVSWDEIECISQNGPNFRYELEFQLMEENISIKKTTNNTMFTANDLQPFTIYTFRVRGVNNAGSGIYTQPISVATDQDTPGPVSHFKASPAFSSYVILTWNSPQEPNGVIISYEVTYSVNENDLVTVNLTGITILALPLSPSTRLSNISVRAFTSVGPGPAVWSNDISTLPIVRNCQARVANESVEVFWEKINVTGYIVYYYLASNNNGEEKSVTVHESKSSIAIHDLLSGVEYQFDIAATAEFKDQRIMGDRSTCSSIIIISSRPNTKGRDVGIAVSSTLLLTSAVSVMIVLVGCAVYRSHSHHKKGAVPAVLKENVAYVEGDKRQHLQETELAESLSNEDTIYANVAEA